jgi:hypothetical protein
MIKNKEYTVTASYTHIDASGTECMVEEHHTSTRKRDAIAIGSDIWNAKILLKSTFWIQRPQIIYTVDSKIESTINFTFEGLEIS